MTDPKPVFRTESRSVRRFVGLPEMAKASLWPTVAEILDGARAAHQEIGDQIVLGALDRVLISQIIEGHYLEVYGTLGKLLGLDGQDRKSPDDAVPHFQSGKSLPGQEERKALAKAHRR